MTKVRSYIIGVRKKSDSQKGVRKEQIGKKGLREAKSCGTSVVGIAIL